VRGREVELRIEETFTRFLPPRNPTPPRPPGFFAHWLHRRPPAEKTRTFSITPEPVATDAFSHPLFVRLAGELPVREAKTGDRVFVVQNIFVCLLRDDPPTRARLTAAFDRGADRAWAAAASADELLFALLDRKRWDAALDELRHCEALDATRLVTLIPAEKLPALAHIVQRLSDGERRAFLDGAAQHLTKIGDRASLAWLARGLFDFIPLQQMEPLLLALDGKTSTEQAALEFARVRLRRILDEEPQRAGEFARLAAHLGA
jgi:hypothetical protein